MGKDYEINAIEIILNELMTDSKNVKNQIEFDRLISNYSERIDNLFSVQDGTQQQVKNLDMSELLSNFASWYNNRYNLNVPIDDVDIEKFLRTQPKVRNLDTFIINKLLIDFCDWYKTTDFNCEGSSTNDCIDEYLKNKQNVSINVLKENNEYILQEALFEMFQSGFKLGTKCTKDNAELVKSTFDEILKDLLKNKLLLSQEEFLKSFNLL